MGVIGFEGTVTYNTPNPLTATRVIADSSVVYISNGPFTGLYGTPAAINTPWIFDPSTPTPDLWSVGGYTFDLTSVTSVTRNLFLVIGGKGIISGNGFTSRPATWYFSELPIGGGQHMFAAFTTVPDGGTTIALFGIALVGLRGFRRERS
jgi:hypothetical protein